MTEQAMPTAPARLADKVVILTGAAGNLGSVISRHLLREGARVVMTGRNGERLNAFVDELVAEGYSRDAILPVVADAADPEACRRVVKETVDAWGEIHALVNNAGGAGPKRTLREIPFSDDDRVLTGESETMLDSAMNLLGGPWNMTRATVPHMARCGSIVNVSTIFSRTPYFGRIPYVVPKSGLNTLSRGLAQELGSGEKGIRVNTLYPGPIASERIDTVFAAMDELQHQPPGTTSETFRGLMTNRRASAEDGAMGYRYPTPEDVAATVVFMASGDSSAFAGQNFEVTNGMRVPSQSRAQLVSWPDDRLVDLSRRVVVVLGGEDVDEALVFARRNAARGAKVVLAFRALKAAGQARAQLKGGKEDGRIHLETVDPLVRDSVDRLFEFIAQRFGRLDGLIVLPNTPNGAHGHTLAVARDEDVEGFVEEEIVAPVAFASAMARHMAGWTRLDRAPAVTFVTNPDDGHGNRLNQVRRAAVEEMIRVWRQEDAQLAERGELPWAVEANQLVRFGNNEEENLTFAADWTATLNARVRKMDQINLWVPDSIRRSTGKGAMPMSIQRVLPGLHRGRTVVITGGSLGIGYEIGRFMALAGARVLLSARGRSRLVEARDTILEELRAIGYDTPEERVFIQDGIDVGDEEALARLHDRAVELFGEVDFLINNAGISGAEEMVVDMTLEAWNRTLNANLISNYSLIRRFAPAMKARGEGRMVNVSSYFGGEKYLAVAYPNRADYAVSKAGQRVLAEILSRHLGPEIQINAVAPGPVDGARLKGLDGAPGLFARRGLLILGNKRLAALHTASLDLLRDGSPEAREAFFAMAENDMDALAERKDVHPAVARLAARLRKGSDEASALHHLMNRSIAEKLVARLQGGGHLDDEEAARFLESLAEPPEPFFSQAEIDDTAEKIEHSILNLLHLHRMPTDAQVGLSTVFSLADEIVSGETFHPSGGLKFDRSVTEGELLLPPHEGQLAVLEGKRILIVGEALRKEIVALVKAYGELRVASVDVLVREGGTAKELSRLLEAACEVETAVHTFGDGVEAALDACRKHRGHIDVVVSTPLSPLPLKPLVGNDPEEWNHVLSRDDFATLIDDQLTHHFRIARRAALWHGCQIVLVTPDTSRASTREEFAMALFVKSSLHALTVTLGVETERLPTMPAVNQVQLTRRARAEEPSTPEEHAEEMERMLGAILLCSVPAPSPKESRYLARIFRGNAVTV
jgi:malonyl-CoA reductase/3-hydroxypropionate dehydrogenase (NADP+)